MLSFMRNTNFSQFLNITIYSILLSLNTNGGTGREEKVGHCSWFSFWVLALYMRKVAKKILPRFLGRVEVMCLAASCMEDVPPRVPHVLAVPAMADLPQPGRQLAETWHLFSVRSLKCVSCNLASHCRLQEHPGVTRGEGCDEKQHCVY